MLPSAWHLRLQQLESNITQILKLLNEYEEELLDEDNPGIKSKYRRRIESLKQQKVEYEKEFEELKIQSDYGHSLQTHNLSEQLQEIDNKIELLLDNQVVLGPGLFHSKQIDKGFETKARESLSLSHIIKAFIAIQIEG